MTETSREIRVRQRQQERDGRKTETAKEIGGR